jgi:hypothetical protein
MPEELAPPPCCAVRALSLISDHTKQSFVEVGEETFMTGTDAFGRNHG